MDDPTTGGDGNCGPGGGDGQRGEGGARGDWFVGDDMHEHRMAPARTLLDDDRVMVIGGFNDAGGVFGGAGNTVEIYDADRDRWIWAAPIPQLHAGPGYAATLPSGKVLHIGGIINDDAGIDFSEANLTFIFDPHGSTRQANGKQLPGKWTPAAPLPGLGLANVNQNAVVTGGTVLIAGGLSDDSITDADAPYWTGSRRSFAYDIRAGTWKESDLVEPRAHTPLTLLADGRVFVAGGRQLFLTADDTDIYAATAEIWQSGKWRRVAHPMPVIPEEDGAGCADPKAGDCPSLAPGSRWGHVQHLLPDGRVLIAGGANSLAGNSYNARKSVLLFDPRHESWTRGKHDLPVGLFMALAGDLPDGRVLVATGEVEPTLIDVTTSWIFDPRDETWTPATAMPCITLDALITEGDGLPAGSTGLPSEPYNLQTGLVQLNDGRMVFSGGFSNEVYDGVQQILSQRTYVYDPYARNQTGACPASHLSN